MTLPQVDPARFEAEWRDDQEVLASLAENGDRAELPRSIDVSFTGDEAALDRLADEAEDLGPPIHGPRVMPAPVVEIGRASCRERVLRLV